MAIRAYYKMGIHILPAPYVEAGIELPRLGLSATVDFLIDTGADNTSLHPGDITRLGISYRRMRRSTLTFPSGIGGSMGYFSEPAVLFFRDTDNSLRHFVCDLAVCSRTTEKSVQGLPSILGRDFLNLCSLTLDKANNQVLMEPLNMHGSLVVPPPP